VCLCCSIIRTKRAHSRIRFPGSAFPVVLLVCVDKRQSKQCLPAVASLILAAACSAVIAIWTVIVGEDIKGQLRYKIELAAKTLNHNINLEIFSGFRITTLKFILGS